MQAQRGGGVLIYQSYQTVTRCYTITINCLDDLTLFLTDRIEPKAPLTRYLLFSSDSAVPSCPRAALCAVVPPHPAEPCAK